MKTLIALLTIAGIATAPATAEAHRPERQIDRVSVAIKSGEFTNGEIKRLRADQSALAAYLDYAQADGKISRAERKTLDQLEDRVNRKLYRYGTNERSRR
jgi:hypothetical protein